jgi:predicted MFS family arabinose efflux permease
MPDGDEGGSAVRLGPSLTAIIGARLGGNVLIRFPYTFLTAISRGLGVRVDTATTLLGVRELGGLLSPAIGGVADRGHERRTMVLMALLAGGATVGIAAGPSVWLVTVLLILGGIAKFGLDTAQTAWIGHRVPFGERSRVFGVVELSWALALLAGVPVLGWIESRWGWAAMFVASGGLLLATAVGMLVVVPRDRPEPGHVRVRPRITRATAPMYAYVVLQPFAQMFVFAVYGDWFRTGLGLSNTALASFSVLIGCGELVGTGLTAVVTDRVGKRPAAIAGILVAAPFAALLGVVGRTTWLGIALIVGMALGTEFSFVSALPIIAELDVEARAAAIGLATAIITIARATSSALSGITYVHLGIGATGGVAAVTCVLAAVSLWLVHEPASTPRRPRREA